MKKLIEKSLAITILIFLTSGCSLLTNNTPPKLAAIQIENESEIQAFKKTKIIVYGQDDEGDSIKYSINSRKGNKIEKEGENIFYYTPNGNMTNDVLEINLEDSKGDKSIKEKQVTIKNNFGPSIKTILVNENTSLSIVSGKTASISLTSIDAEGDKIGKSIIKSTLLNKELGNVGTNLNKFIYIAPITTSTSIIYDVLTIYTSDEFGNVSKETKELSIIPNSGPKINTFKIDMKTDLKIVEGKKSQVLISVTDDENDGIGNIQVASKNGSKIEEINLTTSSGAISFSLKAELGVTQEEITTTMTDSLGNIKIEKTIITVSLNTPPEMTTLKVNGVVATNVPTTKESLLQVTAVDKDSDEIVEITMTSLNSANITKVTGKIGEFKYLPTDITKPKDTLTITIKDSAGKTREVNVILDLMENSPPNLISTKINGIVTSDIVKGEKSIVSLEITDPDGDAIKSVVITSEKGSQLIKQPGAYDYEYIAATGITEDKLTIVIKDNVDRTATYSVSLLIKDYAVKEITYVIYMCADNDLNGEKYYDPKYDFAKMDISEIENAVVDNSRINVVVFADFQYDAGYSRGIYIKDGNVLKKVKDLSLEPNTGVKDTLRDFIDYAYDNYKSKKYVMELWGHGVGWWDDIKGRTNNPKRACGLDWTVPNDPTPKLDGDSLDLWELEGAIAESKVKTFDILHTDMCLMATVEVAYQLKNVCKYFAASPELTPGKGADYKGILEYLSKNYNKPTPELAANIQETNFKSFQPVNADKTTGSQYDGTQEAVVYTVFDESKAVEFSEKLNSLALKLNTVEGKSLVYSLKETINQSTKEILTYGGAEYDEVTMYVDLGDFLTKLSETATGTLKTELDGMITYLKNRSGFVIYEKDQDGQYDGKYAKEKGSSGISIFFDFAGTGQTEISKTTSDVIKEYGDAGYFGRESEWTKFLAAFYDIQLIY